MSDDFKLVEEAEQVGCDSYCYCIFDLMIRSSSSQKFTLTLQKIIDSISAVSKILKDIESGNNDEAKRACESLVTQLSVRHDVPMPVNSYISVKTCQLQSCSIVFYAGISIHIAASSR